MASYIRQKPPSWFVGLALLLVLWGLMGCFSFALHMMYGVAMKPDGGAWERAYDATLPAWFPVIFAAATIGGLAGSIALLMRSLYARHFYLISLIAVIVQFSYVFAATDMIGHLGAAQAVPFPVFIVAMAAFQLWFSVKANRRGWIS